MIDIVSTSQVILKEAGYSTRLASLSRSQVLCFEDGSIMGFCFKCATPSDLVKRWKSIEDEILVRFAPSFRAAGAKAWNVYCIFLCDQTAEQPLRREIGWIEENLDRTRKIAASGVASREELIKALLPVLPIQYSPILPDADSTARLIKRIGDIAPKAQQAALDPNRPVSEVVRLLGERL